MCDWSWTYGLPRETRSISARTMRSTMPGRLSSSQDLSNGRSISRTRSSSVRAFCPITVCASELKALSTAATVSFEIRARSGMGSGALVVKTTSDVPSIVWKLGAGFGGGATGDVIDSVKSRTSAAGSEAAGGEAGMGVGVGAGVGAGIDEGMGPDLPAALGGASSSASMASISSWLLAAAAGDGAAFEGAGGAAGFDDVAAGGVAAAAGFGGEACSGALAGLLTSSSAMIRRMEARISSIEGSCAFAAWLIP